MIISSLLWSYVLLYDIMVELFFMASVQVLVYVSFKKWGVNLLAVFSYFCFSGRNATNISFSELFGELVLLL